MSDDPRKGSPECQTKVSIYEVEDGIHVSVEVIRRGSGRGSSYGERSKYPFSETVPLWEPRRRLPFWSRTKPPEPEPFEERLMETIERAKAVAAQAKRQQDEYDRYIDQMLAKAQEQLT